MLETIHASSTPALRQRYNEFLKADWKKETLNGVLLLLWDEITTPGSRPMLPFRNCCNPRRRGRQARIEPTCARRTQTLPPSFSECHHSRRSCSSARFPWGKEQCAIRNGHRLPDFTEPDRGPRGSPFLRGYPEPVVFSNDRFSASQVALPTTIPRNTKAWSMPCTCTPLLSGLRSRPGKRITFICKAF